MGEVKHQHFQGGEYQETSRRKLGYSHKFKDFIAENPGILDAVRKLITSIETDESEYVGYDYEYVDDSEVEVFHLENKGDLKNDTYRVVVNEQTFFIKKGTPTQIRAYGVPVGRANDGAKEWLSSQKAKEILQGIPWAEVVEYKLGYTRNVGPSNEGVGYFVSRFYPASYVRLDSYLSDLGSDQQAEQLRTLLLERVSLLQGKLQNFFDVDTYNMFYSADEDKIILFDLFEGNS